MKLYLQLFLLAALLPLTAAEKAPLPKHQRLLDRTYTFCQTQFYTLNELPGSYLARYVDTPLFLDPDGDNEQRVKTILDLQQNAGLDTVNGIGERAGNASLEEIVMALKTRQDFYQADTRAD